MRVNKKYLSFVLFFILLAASSAVLFLYSQSHPGFYNPVLTINGKSKPIDLPYKADTVPEVKQFSLHFEVEHNAFTSGHYRIVPDDCLVTLKVNENRVDLSGVTKNLCNWKSGFEIDLNRYLKEGVNTFTLSLTDRFGKRGIDVQPITQDWLVSLYKSVLGVTAFFAGYLLLLRFRFSHTMALLFGVGMLIRMFYFIETPWNIRTYDVDGHIDYIVHIATHWSIPDAADCYTCYHPPLYYYVSALFYQAGSLISKQFALGAVQLFSLLLSGTFLLFLLLTFKQLMFSKRVLLLVSAFIIFYPSLMIHSSRIGNDLLLYTAYAGAFYFYLKWLRDGGHALSASTFLVAVAVFTKLNGVVIIAVLGLSYLLHVTVKKQWKRRWKLLLLVAGIYMMIVVSAAALHVNRSDGGLVSNADSLHSGLYVNNKISSYLYFDPEVMIKEGYTNPWQDGKGRENFWNYFWQTSLFGEFSHGEDLKEIARVISTLFIFILLGAILGFFLMRREEAIRATPFIMNALFLVIAAMYLRYSIPASCSNDFRYSVPLVISMGYFLGLFLMMFEHANKPVIKWFMYSVITLFAILSALFTMYL